MVGFQAARRPSGAANENLRSLARVRGLPAWLRSAPLAAPLGRSREAHGDQGEKTRSFPGTTKNLIKAHDNI